MEEAPRTDTLAAKATCTSVPSAKGVAFALEIGRFVAYSFGFISKAAHRLRHSRFPSRQYHQVSAGGLRKTFASDSCPIDRVSPRKVDREPEGTVICPCAETIRHLASLFWRQAHCQRVTEKNNARQYQGDRTIGVHRSCLSQRQSVAAAGEFAASIMHKINNPLEAIWNLSYIVLSRRMPASEPASVT